MKVAGINSYSNQTAKKGAIAGTVASATTIALLRKSLFTDTIKESIELNKPVYKGVLAGGLLSAAIAGVIIGSGALIGKIAGKMIEHHKEKQDIKDEEAVLKSLEN